MHTSHRLIVAVSLALLGLPLLLATADPDPAAPKPLAPSAPAAQPTDPKAPVAPAAPDPNRPEGRRRRPDGGPGGPGGPAGAEQVLPQTVEQSMKLMNRSLKRLHDQIDDPAKKTDNLRLISDAQRGCLAAKGLVPERALEQEKDAAKRPALALEYRKGLIEIMHKLIAMEAALLDGHPEAAKATLTEIITLRDKGHDALGVKDD